MSLNPKYQYAADKALSAIITWGEPATITSPGTPAYNPATGTYAAGTAVLHYVQAVPPVPVSVNRVDGQNVLSTDYETKIAAKAMTTQPKVGWLFKRGSTDEYSIVGVGILGPIDMPIVYNLQLRRI